MSANKDSDNVRLNFYMKAYLVKAIDEYANRLGINRSAAISVLCKTQLDSINTMKDIGQFSSVLDDFAKKLGKMQSSLK